MTGARLKNYGCWRDVEVMKPDEPNIGRSTNQAQFSAAVFNNFVAPGRRKVSKVVEVARVSSAEYIEAGNYGPSLENQLKPHGFTLRHFPQSFEFSTLGGWIATRSGGHFASLHTHIDDFVESLRVVTPVGVVETRRLPGSGAGPSPDRMFIGSQGN